MSELSGIRVCLATSGHEADDDRIYFKEARSLAKAGADVVVLCARGQKVPAPAEGVRFADYDGGGGLRNRVRTIGKLEAAIADQRCDVVHCHEPDSLVAAVRVKRRLGTKVIFDSHELWAGVAAARFPRPFWPAAMAGYRAWERGWIAACDAAIGASRSIADDLAGLLGPDRVATILNVPVEEVFGDCGERSWGDETILCHDGSLTFARGLKVMAEAVRRVSARHRVVLKIVGDVFGAEREWLDAFVARHGMEKTILRTGWLPYADVGRALGSGHVGLICFQPLPNHLIAAPNKCFNYLLCGQPVLGPDFPRSHFAVLAAEGCAILADPRSAQSYADALERMIADRPATEAMAAVARELSATRYRWRHMEPVLFNLYRRVLAETPRP